MQNANKKPVVCEEPVRVARASQLTAHRFSSIWISFFSRQIQVYQQCTHTRNGTECSVSIVDRCVVRIASCYEQRNVKVCSANSLAQTHTQHIRKVQFHSINFFFFSDLQIIKSNDFAGGDLPLKLNRKRSIDSAAATQTRRDPEISSIHIQTALWCESIAIAPQTSTYKYNFFFSSPMRVNDKSNRKIIVCRAVSCLVQTRNCWVAKL